MKPKARMESDYKARGRSNRLVQQTGEYLSSAELARLGFLASPFSGNVPEFDILAADARLRTFPIQVKTIKGGGLAI